MCELDWQPHNFQPIEIFTRRARDEIFIVRCIVDIKWRSTSSVSADPLGEKRKETRWNCFGQKCEPFVKFPGIFLNGILHLSCYIASSVLQLNIGMTVENCRKNIYLTQRLAYVEQGRNHAWNKVGDNICSTLFFHSDCGFRQAEQTSWVVYQGLLTGSTRAPMRFSQFESASKKQLSQMCLREIKNIWWAGKKRIRRNQAFRMYISMHSNIFWLLYLQ